MLQIPRFRPNSFDEPGLSKKIQAAITGVISHGRFILGPEVLQLEEKIASYFTIPHAVGCASGSDALCLSLLAEEIGPDDIVLTSAYSFFATAGSIARVGATPVFIDVAEDSFHLDVDKLASYLNSCVYTQKTLWDKKHNKRVRAILPVHLFGNIISIKPIFTLAQKYGLILIEDAAQAIGADHIGVFADYTCLSFFPTKNLGAMGDGGMVLCQKPENAKRLRSLRAHGRVENRYVRSGLNSRLDTIQAAILLAKLPFLQKWLQKRREIADLYQEKLQQSPTITLPKPTPGRSWNQFVIRHSNREKLQEFLEKSGVKTAVYYQTPLPCEPCFAPLQTSNESFPFAKAASRESLCLPLFPGLTKKEQSWVIQCVQDFAKSSR